jgi:putative ABC transport system substrate-binding protein
VSFRRAHLHACLLLVVALTTFASPVTAGGVLVVRAKGTQIDEAVTSLKSELAAVSISGEIVVDEATSPAAVQDKANAIGKDGVVVAVGARAVQLALQQKSAPVVHCMVLQDAGAYDTATSVGVPLSVSARARLDAMRRVAPAAKKLGVLYDPRVNARAIAELEAAAKSTGHVIVRSTVSSEKDAPAALDALLPRVDGLIVIPDATVVTKQLVAFLVARAFDKRVPVLAFSEALVRVGALAALAPQYRDNGKQCGKLAKRVLAGEKPAELHGVVEMQGALVVNTATAKKIGVTLSPEVLRPPTVLVGE